MVEAVLSRRPLTAEQEELLDLRDEVYDLREENAKLKLQALFNVEEVSRLNRELQRVRVLAESGLRSMPPEFVFPRSWGLRPQESRLLSALLVADGKTILYDELVAVVSTPNRLSSDKTLKTIRSTMQKKIRHTGLVVQSEAGRGYSIDPSTQSQMRREITIASPSRTVTMPNDDQ